MNKKILISVMMFLLISSIIGYGIQVGSYMKASFDSNDARINRAFNLVRDDIFNKNGGSSNVGVIPIAVYYQVVNGINYKIIAATKDIKNRRVELVHSIVYSGPFSVDFENQIPTITFFEKLSSDIVAIEETKVNTIKNTIQTSLLKLNYTLVKVISISSHPNLVYNEGYYVVNADTSSNNTTSNQFFIVSQNSDGTYAVVKTIFFN